MFDLIKIKKAAQEKEEALEELREDIEKLVEVLSEAFEDQTVLIKTKIGGIKFKHYPAGGYRSKGPPTFNIINP